MGVTVGDIDLDLRVNRKQFNKDVNSIKNDAKKSFSGLQVALGNIMAQIATKALSAIGKFVSSSIEEGSRLSELENVTTTVFGNMANQVEDFSKKALTAYGLNETQAKKMMGTYGAMSKAFGFSQNAVYDMAESVTGLTGDVASFFNLDINEAGTKLKSIFTGETESLKDLGVVMTQTALDEFALSQGFGKLTSQMSEQEKVSLRLAFVQERLSYVSGDFAKTSNSWANQTRILAGQFQSLKAALGQGFIAALTPVVKMLNTLMGKLVALANTFKNFMEAIFGGQSSGGGSNAVQEVADATGTASNSSQNMADSIGDAATNAKELRKTLMGIDEINANNADIGGSSGSGGSFGDTGGLDMPDMDTSSVEAGLTAFQKKVKDVLDKIKGYIEEHAEFFSFAVGGVVGHIAYLMKYNDEFAAKFKDALSRINTAISDMYNGVLAPFVEFFLTGFIDPIINSIETDLLPVFADGYIFAANTLAQIIELMTLVTDTILNVIVKPFLELLRDVTIDMLGIISTTWAEHGQAIQDKTAELMENLKVLWTQLDTNIIQPIIKPALEFLKEMWDKYLKELVTQMFDFVAFCNEAALDLLNKFIIPVIGWFSELLSPEIKKTMGFVTDIIGGAISAISSYLENFMLKMRGLIDFVVGVFTGDWKRAWRGVQEAFSGEMGMMGSILKGIMNGVIALINKALYNTTDKINELINGSIDILNKIPGIDIKGRVSLPSKIPYLAKGGIINQPTLAMVGEQGREAVIPLQNNQSGIKEIANLIASLMPNNANTLANSGLSGDIVMVCDGEVLGKIALNEIMKLTRQGVVSMMPI